MALKRGTVERTTATVGEGERSAIDSQPRVRLLILASSLWIGGAETVIKHLAENTDRRRFETLVCHLKQRGHIGEAIAASGVDVVGAGVFPWPGGKYLTFMKLLRLVRARKIEVIHSHTAHGLVDATICRLFVPGLAVIHTFHFGNYPHTRPRIIWMERVFSRFASRLCAVGDVQRGQLTKLYGFTEADMQTIWNGVPEAAEDDGAAFRASLKTGNRVLIGTIATFIEQKGLRDLMHVAKRLVDAGRQVQFVVVGEGKLRGEIEALRSRLGLEDTVVLTGWVTDAAKVALPAFDIKFQPSLWEAMSVVVLEAMAAGKPVVATRVGENARVIDDGLDGLLADVHDVDGMAAALDRLVGDEPLRRRMGAAGRAKARKRFSVEAMTRAYENLYLDALR